MEHPAQHPNPYSALIDHLNRDGLPTAAKKLDYLLRDIMWTTHTDFLGAFGTEMQKTKRAYGDRMGGATQEAFARAAAPILKIWPDFDL